MEPWMVIFGVLVLVVALVVYVAAKSGGKPKAAPKRPGMLPTRIPVRKASPNINVPSVTPIPIAPAAPLTPGRLDRLFVDGEEVDSTLDPVQNVVIKTKLSRVVAKRGKSYVLKLVVTAEPLADPADREKLRDWLSRPAAPDGLPGAHQLHVVTAARTVDTILMSEPRIKLIGEGIQERQETASPAQRYIKLYFYGDKPMRVEIEIPWTVTQKEIPEWAWTAFKIDWKPRRVHASIPAMENESAEKEVVIQ